jgi:serine/threonine-protein kinase
MEAFHTHQRVAGLQQSLEERVLLLESRTREVQALNVELQRQLSSNASELATMLAKASASLGPPLLEVGALVDGRYRIKRPLGQGGMGAVFEALRLADGSRFAIKVIASHYGPKAIARLAREAESALKVNSPHVVAMRDIGTTSDGHLFIAMDLVEGNSLADELGRFGDRTWCLSVLRQVAQGLAAIHQAGVVHRDIKPRNILVSYMTDPLVPEIKITDFGLATLNYESLTDTQTDGASPSLTRTGSVLGTPGYMAPEAYDGAKDLGPSSDIFSFGILAREILQPTRGEPAFPMGLLLQVNPDTPVDSISKHCDFLSDSLVRLLDACTDPAPEKRPSAEDLLRAFEQESSIAPPRA